MGIKRKQTLPVLIILLAGFLFGIEVSLTPVSGPVRFAGITVGVSTDSEVRQLLGDGVFRDELGDTGSRIYVDPKRKATLYTVNYTDGIVGLLVIQRGIAVKPQEVMSAISKGFNPEEGFGNHNALHLGSTKKEVKKNLGDPAKDSAPDVWRYEEECASCDIEKPFFILHFKHGRIWKVEFDSDFPG